MNTILITGANRGLGLEMSKQYSALGWQVLACCRSPSTAKDLNALAKNSQFHIFKLDVTSEEEIQSLATQLKDQPIDILINNAGILKTYDSSAPIDCQAWRDSLQVNSIAPAIMAKAFSPQVAMSQHKLIVNISSVIGSISSITNPDYLFYGSSKAALNYVTKSLALSLKEQEISIISVHPGWVQTDMGGHKAPTHPEQSVKAIRTLLEGISIEHSGQFYNSEGDVIPY